MAIQTTKSKPELLSEMIKAIEVGKITIKMAKNYIEDFINGKSLAAWMKKHKIQKVSDFDILSELAEELIIKFQVFNFIFSDLIKE